MIRRRVFVSGLVQGVGFRASLVREASLFPGITGFVRNLRDGRVEALIQGQASSVLTLVAWCRIGPSKAEVSALEVVEELPATDLAPFLEQESV